MLVFDDPVFQMSREAGLNVMQTRAGNDQLLIDEALVQQLVNILEFRPGSFARARLRHVAEKILVEIDGSFWVRLSM